MNTEVKLPFERSEYAARLAKTRAAMAKRVWSC